MRGKTRKKLPAVFAQIRRPLIRLSKQDEDRIDRVPTGRLLKMSAHMFYMSCVSFWRRHKVASRILAIGLVLILLFSILHQLYQTREALNKYDIAQAQVVLPAPVELLDQKLEVNSDGSLSYNKGYAPSVGDMGQVFGPKFTAEFASGGKSSVTVTDPQNEVAITVQPKFAVGSPQKDKNRVIYPITGKQGTIVYTAQGSRLKEDIILYKSVGDSVSFEYELVLDSGLEARLEQNGDIAVYGLDGALASSNIAIGTEEDAGLLEKAKQNAEKTRLLFTIPAPVVVEPTGLSDTVKSYYTLEGTVLGVHAENLDKAQYPLSIDPTIYIDSARKLMRGNNETNIDFDIDNELIQKSQTTGARIDAWSSTTNLSTAVFGQGTTVAGGFIYSAGGGGAGVPNTTVYNTAGSSTFNVPSGVTSITIKAWGGGGSGGNGSGGAGRGGNGGGGGYAKAVISVTPSESLDVRVGSGGADTGTVSSGGGNGGGFSAVERSGTYLVQAGGGGGGGGSRGNGNGDGGNGGAGGGATAATGVNGENGAGGGQAGSTTLTGAPSDGGTAGTGGTAGASGAANAGGNGAGSDAATCNDAMEAGDTGGAGGTGGGGADGNDTSSCSNGGGGGGGRFGGGGGGSTTSNNAGGGGGGGGSSLVTGTSTVETTGSGQTPGNNGDSDRAGFGDGGSGGTSTSGGTAGDDGIVIISYVTPGAVTDNVSWAQFNTSTNAIQSPNPGSGPCTGWCNQSAYNLPSVRQGHSLVAYNGFLYAIGGADGSGTPQTTVYIAKIGANGEPQLWHPSGGTPVYWYTDTALSNARSQFAAVVHNNKMYLLGGLTTSSTVLSSNTVQVADIRPTGTLTTWTTTGTVALTTARYGITAHQYNGVLYVLGGNATIGGSPVATVEYSKLDDDGDMNAWVATSSITSGRATIGGSFSTIFGGYMYVAGGCSTVSGSGYCTAVANDVQLASINSDGSLGPWNNILGLSNDRFGHTLIAWQGGLYRLGGCRSQDGGTGACGDTVLDVDYGVINKTGEASTVETSVASGASPCSGGTPYSCNLPGTAQIGNMLNGVAILNGYLYILGGCTNNACTTSIGNVAYQSIGSDGKLTRPDSCPAGTYVDSFCVDNINTLAGSRVAASVTVFNNVLYVVGGNNGGALSNALQYAAVNTDGSLQGAWTTQTLAGAGTALGAASVSFTYAYARANPSAASTVPGNLYIFGGCSGSGPGCTGYVDDVYKCEILPSGAIGNGSNGGNDCTTAGQLQIGTIPGASGTGLAAHAGVVYANYIYLVGGLADGLVDLTTVRYARFDNNNNVVTVSSGWVESPNQMNTGRRRGAGIGYNGYIYVVGGFEAVTGVLADIEFAKIDVSDGSIGAFNISSVTINQRWGLTVAVSNSYAYVIGGCTVGASPGSCTTRTDTIQTFQIYNNDSGTAVAYTTDDLFTTDRLGGSSAILNGYLYLAGGCVSTDDCSDATSSVQYAPIDIYGNLGAWNSTTALTQDRVWGQLEAVGNSLYFIGGQDDGATAQSTVYYATPLSDGTIPSWTSTQALPAARSQHSATVWNNRIYVTGGVTGGTTQDTIYISPALPTGGAIGSAWNSTSGTATAFNVARSGHTAVAYANNLYILGGYDGTNYLSDTQFASLGYKTGTIGQSGTTVSGSGTTFTSAQVGSTLQYQDGSTATITGYTNATTLTVNVSKTVTGGSIYTIMDGSVGAWTYSTSLPVALRQADGFAANGYIYLVGGRSSDDECSPQTLVAPISANTTIVTGNNPTGVGQWFETNVRYTGDRYGAAVSYSAGRVYALGGACPSFPTIASVNTTSNNTESTTNNVTMPAVVEASDLLLVLLTTDGGSTVTTPAGWTQVGGTSYTNGANLTASLYARIADGSEDGTNVNFVTSANEKSAAHTYRILAGTWFGTIATGIEWTGASAGNVNNPNPPTLNPTNWGTENTLWLAYAAGSTYTGLTNIPTDFTNPNHVNTATTDGTGASASSSRLNSVAASVNPADFTMANTSDGVEATIAVRPPNGNQITYTGSNRVYKTAVYSQPQVAQYSRMIDTDTDVFPTSWLMNGLDNSVGARWQARYRSMHDPNDSPAVNPSEDCGTSASMATMTTWGQDFDYGDVILGDVAAYVARESGGGNINCARFFYFYVSIDASQTFGYPEDVNRGPTISDLSLFFTSDPSKRLRHGKTFTGGEQQPLDTPCRQSVDANCPLP